MFEINEEMKVIGHADVLHKVGKDVTLDEIIALLRTYKDKLYDPSKGLFWLKKGSKQLVSLRSSDDLHSCKNEYTGDIRIACQIARSKGTYSLY